MNRLLAKSYDRQKHGTTPPDYALLTQHSRDVAMACDALARAVGPIALSNAALSPALFARFRLTLRANGWIQDLGKASSHFQEMVTSKPQIKQLMRHETISGLLIWLDDRLRQWLAPLSETLLMAVWGAMGHHRKFDEHTTPEQCLPLTVHVAHPDFTAILSEMSADLELEAPPCFDRNLIIARTARESGDVAAREALRDLQDDFTEREIDFANDEERRLLALIKGFGIAADVAASAVAARGQWATNYSLAAYVTESLAVGLTPGDLSVLISSWAWERSRYERNRQDPTALPPDFTVRDFQNAVARSEAVLTLAQAGCGSGKSLAAYMWARTWCQRAAEMGRTNFRVFFCLPTTGTTTEHFRDYALESGLDTSLCHARASVDLRTMAETATQEEASEEERDTAAAARTALQAERDKIESLALWSTPLVVTTADTVLGLMSNARRAIYSLPAIMCSAIVFDEIHAFDEQLFGHLLVFLKHFPRLPVLLMTASLPEERRRAIARVRPDLCVIHGPEEFETLRRYRINDSATDDETWHAVEQCLAAHGKVLWVRNRVDWANHTFAECRKRYPSLYVDLYHSRFRYKDRSVRHRRVIDHFKTTDAGAILVATQVAEMSLDLSADLLITDLAPIPSLIQRLGRLNRRSVPEHPQPPKPALVHALPHGEAHVELPYEKAELEKARQWLRMLVERGQALHQRDLAEAFAAYSDAKDYGLAAAEERAVFFSGLWRTRPGLTRGEGYTISVLLEADVRACHERDTHGEPTRDWIRQHEVAIPFREAVLKWERLGTIRIAPQNAVAYDYNEETHEGTGAQWKRN